MNSRNVKVKTRPRPHHGSYHPGQASGAETCLHEVHEYEFRDERHYRKNEEHRGYNLPPWGGAHWADMSSSGGYKKGKLQLESVQTPSGWSWAGNWKVILGDGKDPQGWAYAETMRSFRKGGDGGTGHSGNRFKVRRREWVRKRVKGGKGPSRGSSGVSQTSASSLASSSHKKNLKQKSDPGALKSALSDTLQRLVAGTSALEGLAARMGGPRDGSSLRNQVKERSYALHQVVRRAEGHLNELKALERSISSSSQGNSESKKKSLTTIRAARNKLGNDLARAKKRFEVVDSKVKDKARQAPIGGGSGGRRGGRSPPAASASTGKSGRYVTREERDRYVNERLMVQDNVNINNSIIEERDEAMKDIHKNLVEVREVFADLADLVADQDHSIKLIEEHVDNSRAKAHEGLEELRKADYNQRNGGCSIS